MHACLLVQRAVMEKIKPHLQNMFSQIDLIAPQDHISSNRYLDLGYRKDKLKVTGNIKYDLSITDELREKIDALRALLGKKSSDLGCGEYP